MRHRHAQVPKARFEELVSRHHPAVYRSALRVVREAAAAEDVTQQVYVALLDGRITLTGENDERVLRWFAVRTALAELRGDQHRQEREDRFAMSHEEAFESDVVEKGDLNSLLKRLVAALPVDLQLALRLRFEEDMTFAAMGDALSISEPSAHERVQRALGRLREKLARAGLAAQVVDLETRLAASAVNAPVPAGLARSLLGLHAAHATGSAAVLSWPALMALVAGGALGVTLWMSLSGADEPRATDTVAPLVAMTDANAANEAAVAEPETREAISSRSSVSIVPLPNSRPNPAASVELQGYVTGVLVDKSGNLLEGVVISAHTIERDGKMWRHEARATTAQDGRFRIQVPIDAHEGQNYVLWLETGASFTEGAPAPIRALPGKDVFAGTLAVDPSNLDRPGDYTLVVTLKDERGVPLPKIPVRMFRNVRPPDGFSLRTWEAGGLTDDAGLIRLSGKHVGSKHLSVDGRAMGWKGSRRDFELAHGAHEQTIVLAKGLEIAGTLRDLAGKPVVDEPNARAFGQGLSLHAVIASEPNEWFLAEIDAQGAFRIVGLDEGAHDLRFSGGPWSSVCLDGVRAGTLDLAIVLKLNDDPRDVGNHCAEIHGRLIDARTKAPIAAELECLETMTLPAEMTLTQFEEDWKAGALWPVPRQTMSNGPEPLPSDTFHATGLPAGRWVIVARIPGRPTAYAGPFELGVNGMARDVEIAIPEGAPITISGRVLDRDGKPLARAFVFLTGIGPRSDKAAAEIDREVREADGKPAPYTPALFKTDADGRFSIQGVPSTLAFRLVALHSRREPATTNRLTVDSAREVELRFARDR